MPGGAWKSVQGGSRKWLPEQRQDQEATAGRPGSHSRSHPGISGDCCGDPPSWSLARQPVVTGDVVLAADGQAADLRSARPGPAGQISPAFETDYPWALTGRRPRG